MKEDAMPKRPWTVTTALYMLWLSILWLPAIDTLWDWSKLGISWRHSEHVNSDLLVVPVVIPLGLWLTLALVVYNVGRGRNWARILLLISLLLSAPFSLLSIIRDASGHSACPARLCYPLYDIIQLEIWLVAAVLLFQRSSSRWFKAMERLRTKDESAAAIFWPWLRFKIF